MGVASCKHQCLQPFGTYSSFIKVIMGQKGNRNVYVPFPKAESECFRWFKVGTYLQNRGGKVRSVSEQPGLTKLRKGCMVHETRF